MIKFIKNLFCKLFCKKSKNLVENSNLVVDGIQGQQPSITYMLNDPAYPEIQKTIPVPETNRLEIFVRFFSGKGAGLDRPEGKAANVYALLCFGINYFNNKLNLNKWASVKKLNVDPLAGIQANAFYDRQNLKFFQFKNKQGHDVFTCLSSDIVSHELGHALLDAIRPEFFNAASAEVWAFHESFGDIVSILCSLQHDEILAKLWDQTKGDLRVSNIVSEVAEQFGTSLGMIGGLRNANNNFKYIPPEKLPRNSPHDQLSSECHNFSRVMTGAFYDLLIGLTNHNGKNIDALKKSRDFLFDTFLDACRTAPHASNFYHTFCLTWLSIAEKNSKEFGAIMKNLLGERNMLPQPTAQNHVEKEYKIQKHTEFGFAINNIKIDKFTGSCAVAQLFEGEVVAQSEVMQEIMSLNVSLPVDEMFFALGNGPSTNMCANENEAAECAKYFVQSLVANNLYGKDDTHPWYKDDQNNLVRKHFACDCFTPNYLIPGSPEYGKPYKPKNNSGCCTYGSCANDEEKPIKKIENTCNLRYSSSCGSINYRGNC